MPREEQLEEMLQVADAKARGEWLCWQGYERVWLELLCLDKAQLEEMLQAGGCGQPLPPHAGGSGEIERLKDEGPSG